MSKAKSTHHTGLGKGFDVLLPRDFDTTILMDSNDRVQRLQITAITANAGQPRRYFDEEALEELAASIKQHGLLQPVIVQPARGGTYGLIAGERRWRAAQRAGLTTLPAIIRSAEEHEQLEIALVENVQRVDLSPLEQAASIDRLHQQFNLGHDEIGKRLGKAASTVNNIVRLLQLPEAAQEALHERRISEGHARQILALKDMPDKQTELLKLITEKGWSVRQAERFVTACKDSALGTETKVLQKRIDHQTPETKQLTRSIGAPVSIRRTAHGGKLEIGFGSDTELTRLLALLLALKK